MSANEENQEPPKKKRKNSMADNKTPVSNLYELGSKVRNEIELKNIKLIPSF